MSVTAYSEVCFQRFPPISRQMRKQPMHLSSTWRDYGIQLLLRPSVSSSEVSISTTNQLLQTMNNLKKLLGIVWIILAIYTAYFSIFELAIPKISTGQQEDLVFGIIILCILTPIISLGLGLFGYYSLLGEYNNNKDVVQ